MLTTTTSTNPAQNSDQLVLRKITTAIENARRHALTIERSIAARSASAVGLPNMRTFYEFMSAEILAHKVAYLLNRLSNFSHKIPILDEDGQTRWYRFFRVDAKHRGLVVSFLYSEDMQNPRVHITLRGTNFQDLQSLARDTETTPGHESMLENYALILDGLKRILAIKVHKVDVTVSGHSLGAADAANFTAILTNKMACELRAGTQVQLTSCINSITVNLANAPGVTPQMANSAEASIRFIKSKLGENFNLRVRVLKAAGDPVQQIGAFLFPRTIGKNVNIALLKLNEPAAPVISKITLLLGTIVAFFNPVISAVSSLGYFSWRGLRAHRRFVFADEELPELDQMAFSFSEHDAQIPALNASLHKNTSRFLGWLHASSSASTSAMHEARIVTLTAEDPDYELIAFLPEDTLSASQHSERFII